MSGFERYSYLADDGQYSGEGDFDDDVDLRGYEYDAELFADALASSIPAPQVANTSAYSAAEATTAVSGTEGQQPLEFIEERPIFRRVDSDGRTITTASSAYSHSDAGSNMSSIKFSRARYPNKKGPTDPASRREANKKRQRGHDVTYYNKKKQNVSQMRDEQSSLTTQISAAVATNTGLMARLKSIVGAEAAKAMVPSSGVSTSASALNEGPEASSVVQAAPRKEKTYSSDLPAAHVAQLKDSAARTAAYKARKKKGAEDLKRTVEGQRKQLDSLNNANQDIRTRISTLEEYGRGGGQQEGEPAASSFPAAQSFPETAYGATVGPYGSTLQSYGHLSTTANFSQYSGYNTSAAAFSPSTYRPPHDPSAYLDASNPLAFATAPSPLPPYGQSHDVLSYQVPGAFQDTAGFGGTFGSFDDTAEGFNDTTGNFDDTTGQGGYQ